MPSFLQTNKVKSKTSENKFVQCSKPLAINVLFLGQAIHGLARSELCVDSPLFFSIPFFYAWPVFYVLSL